MKPTFIGLGAQKCASTWLYRLFDNHPDAFVSTSKELNFFSSFYERGSQWYESHFAGASGRSAIGEISPSYFPDWDAPARAHAYDPNLCILLALRDPVERAYSNHLHDIRLGHFKGSDLSFEAGLANNPMYLEQSRYARHLSRWQEFFPMDRMLIVLQEDIHADPQAQARHVYEFLGISTEQVSQFAGRRANESYLPKSRSREKFIRSVGALTRNIGLGWLDRLLRRTGMISALHNRNRLEIRDFVPPLRDETRARLYAAFAEDTMRLAAITGRKSLPWKTWEQADLANAITKPKPTSS
jgi:hypothetical protein